MRKVAMAVLCACSAFAAQTVVTGVVKSPSGAVTAGCTVYVTARTSWLNYDGSNTLQGQTSTATTNASGQFSITLYPNTGSSATSPPGTSYSVSYSCVPAKEIWQVPTSLVAVARGTVVVPTGP